MPESEVNYLRESIFWIDVATNVETIGSSTEVISVIPQVLHCIVSTHIGPEETVFPIPTVNIMVIEYYSHMRVSRNIWELLGHFHT